MFLFFLTAEKSQWRLQVRHGQEQRGGDVLQAAGGAVHHVPTDGATQLQDGGGGHSRHCQRVWSLCYVYYGKNVHLIS